MSNKEYFQYAAIIIICIVFGIILGRKLTSSPVVSTQSVENMPDRSAQKVALAKKYLFDKKTRYDLDTAENSTVTLSKDAIVLEAITTSPEEAAFFNGKKYLSGSWVAGFKIMEIRESEVVLSDKYDKIYYLKAGRSLDSLR